MNIKTDKNIPLPPKRNGKKKMNTGWAHLSRTIESGDSKLFTTSKEAAVFKQAGIEQKRVVRCRTRVQELDGEQGYRVWIF